MATVDLERWSTTTDALGGRGAGLGGATELGCRDLLHERGVRGRDSRTPRRWWWRRCCIRAASGSRLRWLREDARRWSFIEGAVLAEALPDGGSCWAVAAGVAGGGRERELLELPRSFSDDLTNTWWSPFGPGAVADRALEGGSEGWSRWRLSLDGAGARGVCEVPPGPCVLADRRRRLRRRRWSGSQAADSWPGRSRAWTRGSREEKPWLSGAGLRLDREPGDAAGAAGGGGGRHRRREAGGNRGVEAGRGRGGGRRLR